MKKEVRIRVNGEWREAAVAPGETLLEVLRERFGIKSPKIGCERGECGTCTVLLDGRPVRSCLVLAMEVDGQEIVTVEGIGRDGVTPLQQSFVDHNSFQCGFCAPGIVVTATELLERNPSPDREEVQETISGHLCRCTGYTAIIDAIVATGRKETRG